MNVAVIGSRSFRDYAKLCADLDRCRAHWGDFTVISGGAVGADSQAACWAKERGLPLVVFPADWVAYGKRAGFMRNHDIIAAADYVVAFWDGQSKGTHHSLSLAAKKGVRCIIRRFR